MFHTSIFYIKNILFGQFFNFPKFSGKTTPLAQKAKDMTGGKMHGFARKIREIVQKEYFLMQRKSGIFRNLGGGGHETCWPCRPPGPG